MSKENAGRAPGSRILMAEDNAINREVVQRILEHGGYSVDSAVNGQEAVERFLASAEGFYVLILTDIQMPVMNGYAAARAIRASAHPQAQSIPIVALSADTLPADVSAALGSGMNAHVAKPVEPGALLELLDRLTSGA